MCKGHHIFLRKIEFQRIKIYLFRNISPGTQLKWRPADGPACIALGFYRSWWVQISHCVWDGGILGAKLAAQRPIRKIFHVLLVFFQISLFQCSAGTISIFSKWRQNWEARRRLGMAHTSKSIDSAKRQEVLCQDGPRMPLVTLSWDEFRKIPRIKLHSQHMKCNLIIYCFSPNLK